MYPEQITVDTNEAKAHFTEIANNANNGAVYIITKHGKPFVKIIPATDRTDAIQTDAITETLNRYYQNNPPAPDAGLQQAAYRLFAMEDWQHDSQVKSGGRIFLKPTGATLNADKRGRG
jgi:prevent-host-death family protein